MLKRNLIRTVKVRNFNYIYILFQSFLSVPITVTIIRYSSFNILIINILLYYLFITITVVLKHLDE